MTTPALIVENVSKSFRIPHVEYASLRGRVLHPFAKTRVEEFDALNGVSFEVAEGEFFGIVGRNGSGKSTLLKVIAGIYRPDEGRVTVNGSIAPFIELGVGFNPELSGRDNVFINGALLGLSRTRIHERYEAIVDFAELHRFMDMKLRNFSSGMQVRLAFAIALEAGADILLTDEVLAVGDENFQRKCFAVFRQRKAEGRTVIFVTHDMAAVLDFCDRTLLLEDGKLAAIGDTREIVRRYHHVNVGDTAADGSVDLAATDANAAITHVRIRTDEGLVDHATLAQGSQIVIEVATRFREEFVNPIIGVLITDRLGKQLVNTNNWWVRTDAGRVPAGRTLVSTFALENIFSAGEYVIHAEVAEAGPGPVRHGVRDAARFVVTAGIESCGVFDPPVTIAHQITD